MAKKNKNEEVFTPLDLEKFESKINNAHGATRRDAESLYKTKRRRKRAMWIMAFIMIIIIILWLLSYCSTQFGDLVVTVDRSLEGKGIVLSETSDFKETSVVLSGENADRVYHYTYDWFESTGVLDSLDNTDGSHNGDDYFAYTFYIRNNGTETIDYDTSLIVTGVAKSCDEAARIMVYKNGEPTIYAKPQLGTDEPEENTVAFVDEKTVFEGTKEDFKPGDTDKYTVVIWFEGEDSQCVNDIMGGHMRLSMLFEAAELKE